MLAAAAVEMISLKYDGPWKSRCVFGGMRRLLQSVPFVGAPVAAALGSPLESRPASTRPGQLAATELARHV
eukprot:scaffold46372_cov72-Phaeocystis_antarctica.AAC.4